MLRAHGWLLSQQHFSPERLCQYKPAFNCVLKGCRSETLHCQYGYFISLCNFSLFGGWKMSYLFCVTFHLSSLKWVEHLVPCVYWNFVKLFFKAYPSLWQSSFHVLTGENKGRAPFVIWVGQCCACFQFEYFLVLLNWMTVVFSFPACAVWTQTVMRRMMLFPLGLFVCSRTFPFCHT